MYIYCDYCGNWMGFDMKAATNENIKVFARENMNSPEVQQYTSLATEFFNKGKALDIEGFKQSILRFHEMEFKIFPMRHGPKGKQPSFQKKYLDFYKAYYNEVVDEEYLRKKYLLTDPIYDTQQLTYQVENGRVIYEFDENFKKMVDAYVKYISDSVDRDSRLECMALHPEPAAIQSKEVLMDMSIQAFIQAYDEDIAEKIVEYLGMEEKFIEIDDVNLSDYPCRVCSKVLKVPEGATTVFCEDCGSLNELENAMIKCHNCGAAFDPQNKEACPYCTSVFMQHHSINDVIAESYKKATQTNTSKKSLWKRLFGG